MSRLTRGISYVMYHLIAKHLPKSNAKISFCSKFFRRFFAKGMGVRCGKNVNIQRGAIFSSDLIIGDKSSIGINSIISSQVTIGKNVMMGPECYIYTVNHEFSNINLPIIDQGYASPKPVVIEDDVWIGSRVTILGGVKVGAHSVIGAGSVVTKNIPEYSVVGGNPAQILYNRKNKKEN